MQGEIVPCASCGRRVLFARTAGGKLMPVEYDLRNIPPGLERNVAYFRHHSGRTDCYTLKATDTPATIELHFGTDAYVLTVAHFAVCETANQHRRARAGNVDGVIPFPTAAQRRARRTRRP